ncbi:MAG: hypothetical protein AAGE01_05150 [Pseudomonadota bacterium]
MLARYIDGGRIQAASLVAFGVAAPIAFPLGAGAAALVTLRRGLIDGAVVSLLGVAAVVGLVLLAGGGASGILPVVLMLATTVVLAEALRATSSLSYALQLGSVLAVLALLALLAVLGDAENYWRELFAEALDRMVAQGSGLTPDQRDEWLEIMPFAALTGVVVGLATLLVWICLFVGRMWQARLVNPGGFGREFRELSLGRSLALASAGVFFASALVRQDWLLNISALLIHLWIIQGLAYLHWTVGEGERRTLWLVLSYGFLVVFWMTGNPLAVMVPFIGMAGELAGYRRIVTRWRSGGNG